MPTPRIEKIISYIQHADTVADIGCDHGYAALGLIEQGRAKNVIACDISGPSLKKAAQLAKEHRITDRMEMCLGDGLQVLEPGEADTIIIAGMGGMRICSILEQGRNVAEQAKLLVLSPNRNEYDLRKYLCERGFSAVEEGLAHEHGRYYQIICAVPSGETRPQEDWDNYFGKLLIERKDPLLKGFLDKKISELGSVLKKAENGKGTEAYLADVIERKRRLEEVRKCL